MDENTNSEVQEVDESVEKQMDYMGLFGELNDEPFSFLMDYLYPLFNYRVLKKEDVRRIDMAETLVRIENPASDDWEDKKGLRYYLFILKQYYDEYLKCQEGSTAERYKQRAVTVLEQDLDEKSEKSKEELLMDAEDVFLVFISLFRAVDVEFDKIEDCMISEIDFDLYIEDADIIKKIWECEDLVPDEVSGKGGLFGFMKSDTEGLRARKLFYINNLIFLCRGLQKRGAFDEGVN